MAWSCVFFYVQFKLSLHKLVVQRQSAFYIPGIDSIMYDKTFLAVQDVNPYLSHD